jgi:hypothetical protein
MRGDGLQGWWPLMQLNILMPCPRLPLKNALNPSSWWFSVCNCADHFRMPSIGLQNRASHSHWYFAAKTHSHADLQYKLGVLFNSTALGWNLSQYQKFMQVLLGHIAAHNITILQWVGPCLFGHQKSLASSDKQASTNALETMASLELQVSPAVRCSILWLSSSKILCSSHLERNRHESQLEHLAETERRQVVEWRHYWNRDAVCPLVISNLRSHSTSWQPGIRTEYQGPPTIWTLN